MKRVSGLLWANERLLKKVQIFALFLPKCPIWYCQTHDYRVVYLHKIKSRENGSQAKWPQCHRSDPATKWTRPNGQPILARAMICIRLQAKGADPVGMLDLNNLSLLTYYVACIPAMLAMQSSRLNPKEIDYDY